MNKLRRMCIVIVMTAAAFISTAFAQTPATSDYPAKPVRVVVGPAPGGATDLTARMIAQKLRENLRQSFVVENRPGAGGTIGDAVVARSPPDGYTLLAVSSSYAINPAFYSLPYDPIKDFAPISMVTRGPMVLAVHPSLPVSSVKELLALARAKPGMLNVASAGHGTSHHLALELFKSVTRVNVVHIPYKGAGPALVEVVAGHAEVIFANLMSALPQVRLGRLKPLAVTTATRSKSVPELPTMAEVGVAGYEVSTWHAWLAPASTPATIVNRVRSEIVKVLKSPDVVERLAVDGGEPLGSSPEECAQQLAAEITRWRKVVAESGLKR